jgi:hypothetical protein
VVSCPLLWSLISPALAPSTSRAHQMRGRLWPVVAARCCTGVMRQRCYWQTGTGTGGSAIYIYLLLAACCYCHLLCLLGVSCLLFVICHQLLQLPGRMDRGRGSWQLVVPRRCITSYPGDGGLLTGLLAGGTYKEPGACCSHARTPRGEL